MIINQTSLCWHSYTFRIFQSRSTISEPKNFQIPHLQCPFTTGLQYAQPWRAPPQKRRQCPVQCHVNTHHRASGKWIVCCSLCCVLFVITRSTQVDCVWNVMAHALKPYFVFRRNGRVHLNRPGGVSSVDYWHSRGVRISGNNAGYTMFRGSVKSTGYPLHSPVSPSLTLPYVYVCHHISTAVYICYATQFLSVELPPI